MIRSHNIIKSLHGQRGDTAILFVLCLPVLLGLAALSVDLARLNLIKVELQNASDAAALGGAYSISIPSAATNDKPYNWTAATATATQVATSNFANGKKIKDATIDPGYWNITTRTFNTTGGTGYVPAIRATVTISSTKNHGPVKFFFAPIFGIAQSDIQASAIAVTGAPSGGRGMFPFAIGQSFFNSNWKAGSQKNTVTITNVQKGGDGQWTSLTGNTQADSFIDGLITTGNTNYLSIGESIFIANGTKANLYKDANDYNVPGKVYAVPVIAQLNQGTYIGNKIVAIAAFQIVSINQNGANSSITGHFIDGHAFPGLTLGDGSGTLYGAFTAPQMVQ